MFFMGGLPIKQGVDLRKLLMEKLKGLIDKLKYYTYTGTVVV